MASEETSTEKPRQKLFVFDNEKAEALARQFKATGDLVTFRDLCRESNNLMDAIIRSNKFDRQVPFDDLKNSLFLQIENWVRKWDPESGKLYTYFTVCIRNGCLSVVSKEALFHQRFAVTDVPMDALIDQETGHGSEISSALAEALQQAASDIYCRWREPQVQEILRFMVSCVLRGRGDRRPQILKTVELGWDISQDTARFLLDWSHGAVRQSLLDHFHQPLGEVDMFRAAQKFSLVPDIIDAIGVENTKKLLHVFAGVTIRFPSTQQVRKVRDETTIYETLLADGTPETVKALGRKFRKSPSKILEIFESVSSNIRAGVLEDTPLFEGKSPLADL